MLDGMVRNDITWKFHLFKCLGRNAFYPELQRVSRTESFFQIWDIFINGFELKWRSVCVFFFSCQERTIKWARASYKFVKSYLEPTNCSALTKHVFHLYEARKVSWKIRWNGEKVDVAKTRHNNRYWLGVSKEAGEISLWWAVSKFAVNFIFNRFYHRLCCSLHEKTKWMMETERAASPREMRFWTTRAFRKRWEKQLGLFAIHPDSKISARKMASIGTMAKLSIWVSHVRF